MCSIPLDDKQIRIQLFQHRPLPLIIDVTNWPEYEGDWQHVFEPTDDLEWQYVCCTDTEAEASLEVYDGADVAKSRRHVVLPCL